MKFSFADHFPHQFSEEMKHKSEVFIGEIYEKFENKTEDLTAGYQKEMVHINGVSGDDRQAFDRRQVSGDQELRGILTLQHLVKLMINLGGQISIVPVLWSWTT